MKPSSAAGVPLLAEATERLSRILGPAHPATVSALYNRACLAALRGDRDAAVTLLGEVVAQGYAEGDWMARDTDLASLHGDPRFAALVARARANAAAASRPADEAR